MAFRIKEGEPVSEAIKRIVQSQIDKALERLEPDTRNRERAVHEVRVCFKKIRAVLRLIYAQLGPDLFALENCMYRDAGRRLAVSRDTAVVAETLEELVAKLDSRNQEPDIKLLCKRLRSSRRHRKHDWNSIVCQLSAELTSARERVEFWPLKDDGFCSLRPGLRQVYRSGRNDFERVRLECSTRNLHEWRKQVKYLWYQVCILNPAWPQAMALLAKELSKMADYLSDDHDLAMLREHAVHQGELLGTSSEIDRLVSLIDEKRIRLEADAILFGARIYAEKPRQFVDRIAAYWEAWRPTTKNEALETGQMLLPGYAELPRS